MRLAFLVVVLLAGCARSIPQGSFSAAPVQAELGPTWVPVPVERTRPDDRAVISVNRQTVTIHGAGGVTVESETRVVGGKAFTTVSVNGEDITIEADDQHDQRLVLDR